MERLVFRAASDGNLTLLRNLLAGRSLLEIEHYLSAITKGSRPLNIACYHGHLSVAEYILNTYPTALETPGKVSFADEQLRGASPLCGAAIGGHLEVVKHLLSKGADVNSMSAKYYTPLTLACLSGHLDVVKYLLANGADISYVDPCGYTVLHQMCHFPNTATTVDKDILQFLISEGADMNIRNFNGKLFNFITCIL